MKKVLVLCTGNSCRSIIAEALINAELEGVRAYSAGVQATGTVHPFARKVLEKNGIWRDSYRSETIDVYASHQFDLVVTVCDHAKERCPIFDRQTPVVHVAFEDPADKPYEAFEDTYEQIRARLLSFVEERVCADRSSKRRKESMRKEVSESRSGVSIRFSGAVRKSQIVTMVENCAQGRCECMSEETKAKIVDMHVSGRDGDVSLELTGDVDKSEIESALARSKVLRQNDEKE